MHLLDQLSLNQIKQCLQKKPEQTYDVPYQWSEAECKQAGVLIPFVRKNNQWHIIYIRRASLEGDHHSGQIAFAGGKYEEQDADLLATALREAHEEIGIQAHHVEVLGELDHHTSITRFIITPVVAYVDWPYPIQLNQAEVARVFLVPLVWLADPDNYRIEPRQLDGKEIPVVYFNEYDNERLWGATARMTLSLIARLLN